MRMDKKKALQYAAAATLVISASAAAVPADAAVKNADASIKTAQMKMKKAYQIYNQPALKGKVASLSSVRSAVMQAQSAYKKAVSDIEKYGGTKKQKAASLKKLNEGKIYLDRAERYLGAVNINVKKAAADFDQAVAKGYAKNVLAAQTALKKKTDRFQGAVKKVYGPKVRALLTKTYASPAVKKAASVENEMKVYTLYKQIENDKLITTDLERAGKLITAAEPYVKKLAGKKGKLVTNILAAVQKDNAAYNKKAANSPLDLTILHTNDTHAHLDNIAKRASIIKEIRGTNPNALLLDAGDVFSGTLYFNKFLGQADLEFMNLLDYDLMTFGNHEFDLGSSPEGHQALADFVQGAKFPFVSSNIDFSQDKKLSPLYSDTLTADPKGGHIYSEVILTVEGKKVGFFGLTTEETKDIASPGSVKFENYVTEAKKAVSSLEAQGVNKIIAIDHLGYDDNPAYDNDLLLAANVSGIDVIVGGHSHTQLDKPVVVDKDSSGKEKDPTVIVQAYQYSDFVGDLFVSFDGAGKVTKYQGELIAVKDQKEDPETAEKLKKYSSPIDALKAESIGAAAVHALKNPRSGGDNTQPSVRKNETELGNLITDGMLDKAKEYNPDTVMAFQNGGGIREAINEGDITVGEVLTTLPFGNTLATIKLTGAEIIEALEHSVSLEPLENGGFLHVSGMKFTYDSSKPEGSRVADVQVQSKDGSYKALDLKTEYTAATNAFTAKGGDGFDVFKKVYEEGRVTDLGLSDWENLRDYAAKLKTVDPKIEGRIVDIAGK